jgi:hypothetical protein
MPSSTRICVRTTTRPANLYGRLIDDTGFNGSPIPNVEITLSDGRTITKQIKEYEREPLIARRPDRRGR